MIPPPPPPAYKLMNLKSYEDGSKTTGRTARTAKAPFGPAQPFPYVEVKMPERSSAR
ncbi:unnamed protein product [Diplocarpon coronariae]